MIKSAHQDDAWFAWLVALSLGGWTTILEVSRLIEGLLPSLAWN